MENDGPVGCTMLPSHQAYRWGTTGNQGTMAEVQEAFNPRGKGRWTMTMTTGKRLFASVGMEPAL